MLLYLYSLHTLLCCLVICESATAFARENSNVSCLHVYENIAFLFCSCERAGWFEKRQRTKRTRE